VSVEGLDAAEQLLVVAAVDEHLGVVLHRLGEHGQRPGVELLLLPLLELLRSHLRLGLCEQTPGNPPDAQLNYVQLIKLFNE